MNLKRILITTMLLAAVLLLPTARARESWPAPTAAARSQAAKFQQHQQDVLNRIQPALKEWAQKGKPFIPWAARPGDLPQAAVPAFPGAEGAGAHSFGGRGGKVYVVSNLNDSGPGSFREACEAAGPRIVVFNVAGIIQLQEPVFIQAPYITIAGQTAPGDGICIAGQTTQINTHDVVIRYLRFRRGVTNVFNRDDALGGNPVGNVIVDHCSASWGLDENLSMYRHMYEPPGGGKALKLPTVNLTIQWCISSEALNPYNHAFGGTWGGDHCSFHHNLFACNTGRNPSIGMGQYFDFRNNVLFNWHHRTIDGGDASSWVNIVANYFKPGPATLPGELQYRICRPQHLKMFSEASTPGKWYVADNYVAGNPKVTANNWAGGVQFDAGDIKTVGSLPQVIEKVRGQSPTACVPITQEPARQAYELVLANAGATLPRRDPVDQRIIREVRTGKVTYDDGIITEVSQVGGYPDYRGAPEKNLDPDGIPQWWKKKYGLDSADPNLASKDLKGDGYSVMDKYLDGLNPTQKIDWADPASNRNTLTEDNFKP